MGIHWHYAVDESSVVSNREFAALEIITFHSTLFARNERTQSRAQTIEWQSVFLARLLVTDYVGNRNNRIRLQTILGRDQAHARPTSEHKHTEKIQWNDSSSAATRSRFVQHIGCILRRLFAIIILCLRTTNVIFNISPWQKVMMSPRSGQKFRNESVHRYSLRSLSKFFFMSLLSRNKFVAAQMIIIIEIYIHFAPFLFNLFPCYLTLSRSSVFS